MAKNWIPRGTEPLPGETALWAERLGVSELLVQLLWTRGLHTPEDMDVYLSPGLRHLAPPDCWPGLAQAAAVLDDGLAQGLPFAVWGDYDVDGVTSVALVKSFLAAHGIAARHHIPNRFEEGYGMNVAWVERLAQEGVRLLLTVDCGISDHESVARARELGMTVVVSDHHLPGESLPQAHAICNPRLADCPCPALAGVGVAFFLMAALNSRLAQRTGVKADIRPLLDLVALGTIADVVDLSGQNRILVKNGLLVMTEAGRPGIAALKEVSGYSVSASLGAGQVAFGLAPRINAAGRLGEADTALSLLLAPDYAAAAPLAARLDAMNQERKEEEERILEEAREQAAAQQDRMGLVLYAPHWHAGVIGIVASRIVEEFYRPTLILCDEGGVVKGSGRSTAEFHLHEGLTRCADLLLGFGGHRQAAGMSLDHAGVDALRERFHAVVVESCGPHPLTASLKVDAELGFARASDFAMLKELELLQPFGMGNAEPTFSSPVLEVRGNRRFGKNHMQLELLDPSCGVTLRAKAWRQADNLPRDMRGRKMRLAYTPRIDRYNGLASVDLRIKDWELS
ncbi:single-stranded-DNA-specific exonuclease RecJ [Oleidesulfovibrio alaskensis]|uniref:single-stranded-DNA-specific exonuclease RecJ n=1 Tax=Oleidesulfovibrio alaskensis TaxID=58180 RepID=UPI0003FCEAC8|nr:single-stranded-DNA-specific exonuclease RecJ [Oleidesulfovibrio alaskensis]